MNKPSSTLATALAAAMLLAGAVPATAVSWDAKLVATDRQNSDFLGEAVAISGDTVVAGAKLSNVGGFDRGAAYVFVRTGAGWVQQAKLTASDGANSDQFGTSVAISGDTVLIGAPMDDDLDVSAGSAYVFNRSGGTWTQSAKLTAPDGRRDDLFGAAVALSGDVALVASPRSDTKASEAGAVYAFRESGASGGGWELEATLLASDGQAGDLFGQALAIDGDSALISAYADDDTAFEAGAAYFFAREAGAWTQAAKVRAPDGAANDNFGSSVSLSRGSAAISAIGDDDGAPDAGSAYVLRRVDGSWEHEAKLRNPDPVMSDFFGKGVAIDGGAAIVGASHDDTLGRDAGAAYTFERLGGEWTQTAKLTSPDGGEVDLLGYAVDIEGATGVVGEPLADDRANATGSLHVVAGVADLVPPEIAAEVDPSPNEAGWHKDVPVEVTFTCTDAGSGIASCTAPESVALEPGGKVVGTAVDQAGNSASLEVEVRVDTTPPIVTVDDPSPIPGVPVPAATITGTTSDPLSGVEQVAVTFTNLLTSAQETRTATVDGERWTVSAEGVAPGPTSASATAADVAGNVAVASLLFVAQP